MDISQNVYSNSTHLYEKNIYNDIINKMESTINNIKEVCYPKY